VSFQLATTTPDVVVTLSDQLGDGGTLQVVADDAALEIELATIMVGPKGDQGEPGSGDIAAKAVAGVNLTAGMPVCIDRTSGKMVPAQSSLSAYCNAIGLATTDVAAGFAASAGRDLFTQPDWTAVIGTPFLTPGVTYFLDETGGLTSDPPSAVGLFLVTVGIAVGPTTLNVSPQPPILM
jgi:hypothetical protein